MRQDRRNPTDLHSPQARWVRRLVGGAHGDALATEIEEEYRSRSRDASRLRRRLALLALWTELSPRLVVFIVRRSLARRRGGSTGSLMSALGTALQSAFRSLRRRPALSILIIVTLALGIGANATMYGIVDRVLLGAPPHIVEPDRVRRLYINRSLGPRSFTTSSVTYPDYQAFGAVSGFAETAAHSFPQQGTLVIGDATTRVNEVFVSGSFFGLLGAEPAAGRLLGAADDVAGAPDVVVLGHALWQERFGGDPAVLGRMVHISKTPMTVIGIAPRGFTGVDLSRVDAWMPLHSSLTGGEQRWNTGGWYWLAVIARVDAQATTAALESEATAAHLAGRAEDDRYDREARVTVAPLQAARGPNASDESRVSRWLSAVSLAVLLVACANVANLLLARSIQQRAETGVRLALGISRRRMIAEMIAETTMLALGGGLVALPVADQVGGAARALLFPDIQWIDGGTNPKIFGFTLLVALISGVTVALPPALQSAGDDLRSALSRRARSRTGRPRLRGGLTILQCALSVVLLAGAGLFVRSLHEVLDTDLGLRADNVWMVTPAILDVDLSDARTGELFEQAQQRLDAIPGIRKAAFVGGSVPFSLSFVETLSVPGVEEIPSLPGGGPYYHVVSDDYFDTLGLPIVQGRAFTESDGRGAPPVVVVNETMARSLWPDEEAVGKCMYIGDSEPPCAEIVGVARDVRRGYLGAPTMQYYLPWGQRLVSGTPRALLLASEGIEPEALVAAARAELRALEPTLDWVQVRELRAMIDPQARSWRLGATMFSAFGILALVVASIGLYGVLSFEVAQRRREMGVRAALGAAPGHLARTVLLRGLAPTAVGIASGLLAVVALGPWVEPLLHRVSPRDPLVLAAVAGSLVMVAVAAAMLPARRATSIDPAEELRART